MATYSDLINSLSDSLLTYRSSELLLRHATRNSPNSHQKIVNQDFTEIKRLNSLDAIILTLSLFIFPILLPLTCIIIFNINLGFTPFYSLLFTLILTVPSCYLVFTWTATRRKRIAGEKYDAEIKNAVQGLVDYGIELIKENNLNPKDYPIKLRHNDYEGLEYEFKGKKNYICYFKLN